MKIIFLLLLIVSCSKKEKSNPTIPLNFYGKAEIFSEYQMRAFNNAHSIENSLVDFYGEIFALHDPTSKGSFHKTSLGQSGKEYKNDKFISNNRRFSYVMEHNGLYYLFVAAGGVYLYKSNDLENWDLINNGQPVLNSEAGTIYQNIWNPGVTVDDNGVWHLLVESANGLGHPNDQGGVGLAYATATMNGDLINFDATKTSDHVIPKGGNPHVEFISGKGLLVVHGQLNDLTFNLSKDWYVTASVLPTGSNNWQTFKNDFAIGIPGIHVCDPSLIETSSGQLMLTVSVNQDYISTIFADSSFEDLFDSLTH